MHPAVIFELTKLLSFLNELTSCNSQWQAQMGWMKSCTYELLKCSLMLDMNRLLDAARICFVSVMFRCPGLYEVEILTKIKVPASQIFSSCYKSVLHGQLPNWIFYYFYLVKWKCTSSLNISINIRIHSNHAFPLGYVICFSSEILRYIKVNDIRSHSTASPKG